MGHMWDGTVGSSTFHGLLLANELACTLDFSDSASQIDRNHCLHMYGYEYRPQHSGVQVAPVHLCCWGKLHWFTCTFRMSEGTQLTSVVSPNYASVKFVRTRQHCGRSALSSRGPTTLAQ
eukprot:jgi/Botrbrau1/21511/Bobra.174_2s0017.1